MNSALLSRRELLAASAAIAAGARSGFARGGEAENKALIAITLDLEMSRNFPRWEDTHWDYEKGNLNEETKRYTVEACRRVKAAGGVVHCFVVGRVLEQENVDWLKEIAEAGHSIGNHTYDHVNVLATRPSELQFRFQRAPWLIEGKDVPQAIRENIRLTSLAMKSRLGIEPAGFRTPGGFAEGLAGREDIQRLLLDLGFTWVSSKYPGHPMFEPGKQPTSKGYEELADWQQEAQPLAYPSGLIEVPMSPISDIGAFRSGRWKLEWFLKAVEAGVQRAIEQRLTFDFLGHPSCLYVVDPDFKTIDLICDTVRRTGDRAALVDLSVLAKRAK